jgi:hypothetical protein
MGKFDNALLNYSKALALSRNIDLEIEASCLFKIGRIYFRIKNDILKARAFLIDF